MRKTIYHADFRFRYTYQYYTQSKGVLTKSGKPVGPFSALVPKIYLEGDEEQKWEEIKKELGHSDKKRFELTDKRITNIKNTGKQN